MIDRNGEHLGQGSETFFVEVKFVQNATWQGTVRTTKSKEALNFRSALELLKIMDGELTGTDAGAKEPPKRRVRHRAAR